MVDLHSIHGVDADVIELEVKESSKICNHSIQELDFPRDAIIGGVIRNSVAYTVRGDFKFMGNDKVVVICLHKSKNIIQSFFK